LYPMMIHGVYRCGFARTQAAYDRAIDELTGTWRKTEMNFRHLRVNPIANMSSFRRRI
jgi:glutathionyl-hydroquinone reductase